MNKPPVILVTGVGAIIGYGIIQSLKKCSYHCHIVGIDIYSDAIGRVWCDEFVQGVLAESPEFEDFVCDLVKRLNVKLIIPCIEQDMTALNEMRQRLEGLGSVPVLNTPECIEIFDSKLATMALLNKLGLPELQTFSSDVFDVETVEKALGFPCLAKPDNSFARRGHASVMDKQLLEYYMNCPGYLLQEYIHGEGVCEYTASVFGLGDGRFVNMIILRRTLGPDGATHKAATVTNSVISQQICKIVEYAKPLGPTNFQFIYDPVKNLHFLLEVNPRVSSSSSIRAAFGANEAQMCVQYFLKGEVPDPVSIKIGSAQRYIVDYIQYDCPNL